MVSRAILFSTAFTALLLALNYYALNNRPTKKVWMTLLTNDKYLSGALTLDYSLKRSASKYPLVVFHPSTLDAQSIEELHRRDIVTREVNLLLPSTRKEYGLDERFYDCWSKLIPHGMTEYQRVVELDADMLVRENADELIEMNLSKGTMAATHACVCNPRNFSHYPKDWIHENCAYTHQHDSPEEAHLLDHAVHSSFGTGILNGGLQVIDPSRKHFNDILSIMSNATLTDTFEFADQSVLSHYFKDKWVPLPYTYNALKTLRSTHAPIWRDDKAKIIHYILGDKPWDDPLKGDSEFVPNTWWWQINNERLHHEKIQQIGRDVEQLIAKNKVVVFSKSYCPHCRAAKQLFKSEGQPHQIIELDQVPDGDLIQQYLVSKSGARTVPQIFVRSKFIGGNSDLQNIAQQSNGLKKLLI